MIKRILYSVLSKVAPEDKNVLWIDTSDPYFTFKLYLNGDWSVIHKTESSEITKEYIDNLIEELNTNFQNKYEELKQEIDTTKYYDITSILENSFSSIYQESEVKNCIFSKNYKFISTTSDNKKYSYVGFLYNNNCAFIGINTNEDIEMVIVKYDYSPEKYIFIEKNSIQSMIDASINKAITTAQ